MTALKIIPHGDHWRVWDLSGKKPRLVSAHTTEQEAEAAWKPKQLHKPSAKWKVINFQMSRGNARDLVNELTPREAEVAELIAFGEKRAAIAKKLGISVKTLEHYLFHIHKKWQVPLWGIGMIWFCAKSGD